MADLDVRKSDIIHFRTPDPEAPHDLEAEQALLGTLIFDLKAAEVISDELEPEAFHEPLHARIFAKLQTVGAGDALTLYHALSPDGALEQLGGMRYLADLVDRAPASSLVAEYAQVVRTLWQRREIAALAQEAIVSTRQGVDPSEIIEAQEQGLLAVQMQSKRVSLVSAADAADRTMLELENPRVAFGTRLGLQPLDDVTGGFMPGELWLFAGRPSMGKSAVVSTADLNIALHGLGADGERMGSIEICSEMTVGQLTRRHITDLAYALHGPDAPSYSNIRKRNVTAEQLAIFRESAMAFRRIDTLKLLYRTNLTIQTLRSTIRRQKAAWSRIGVKLAMVSVDHAGLVRASQAAQRGHRSEAQGEIARDMKQLAGELDVALAVVVQLNRKVEDRDDKRPQLADLRDSGEWEENADGVIGFYREAYYAQRELEPKRHEEKLLWEERRSSPWIEAILLKIREGEAQTVKLWGDMARNAIRGGIPDSAYRRHGLDFGRSSAALDAAALNPDAPLPPGGFATYSPGEFE